MCVSSVLSWVGCDVSRRNTQADIKGTAGSVGIAQPLVSVMSRLELIIRVVHASKQRLRMDREAAALQLIPLQALIALAHLLRVTVWHMPGSSSSQNLFRGGCERG